MAVRVEALRRDLGVDVAVYDMNGEVIARAGVVPPIPLHELRAIAMAGRPMRWGHGPWHAVAPVRDPDGAGPGAIVVVHGRPHEGAAWLALPLVSLAIILLGAGLASAPLARRLTRPLENLEAAARHLGSGDLKYRLDPPAGRPPKEIARLTQSFNDMAERIEALVEGHKALLANVSHELRSPLARIRVALELLPRTEGSAARLADLERDLVDLDRLISDVLTASRLEGGAPPRLGDVDVGALLADLLRQASLHPATAGREIRCEVEPGLSLHADESLLRRALWNLVENAAKYGAPPILLSARSEGDRVLLAVADEGPGIPKNDRERVLEPFYRRDPARTPESDADSPQGFGLGLTLARQVAVAHGGSIHIEPTRSVDTRETGCRVVLSLPRIGPPNATPTEAS
jgi:signal transduction histidine kinase